jgi:hypothetical protein
MCCDDDESQSHWKSDLCFISLFVTLTAVYVGIGVLLFLSGHPSLDLLHTPGSIVISDKCNVRVIAASITRAIDLTCSESPIINAGRPKLNVNCSNIHQEVGNNAPMYCDPKTNICAPYCVEYRERLGSTQMFECSWDATKMISNATVVISPINDKLNRSYTFNEVAPVIGAVPTHLQHQVERSLSNHAITSGILRVASCAYRVDSSGVISDGKISLMHPIAHIVLCIFFMLLMGVVYFLLIVVILTFGGTASLKRIESHVLSLIRRRVIPFYNANDWRNLSWPFVVMSIIALYTVFGFGFLPSVVLLLSSYTFLFLL